MPVAKKNTKKVAKKVRVVKKVKKNSAAAKAAEAAQVSAAAAASAAQVSAPAPDEPVAEVAAPVQEEWETTFSLLTEQASALTQTTRALTSTLRKVHKQWAKALKDARKQSSKRKSRSSGAKRAPSGFAKPSAISKELCDFLGKPEGTEMARTEVTRLLTQYIKENSLQDPDNKRKIVPDDSLTALLQVGSDAELTYFNLQKYMKRHFPKSAASARASA